MKIYPPSIKDFIPFDKNGGVFFVHVFERYIIKKMKEELRQFVSENQTYSLFFLDMNEGRNVLSEAINTSREIGFFCSQKIVVLELSEKLSDKEREFLESYIDNAEPLNYLIVFITEIDKRTKFYKSLQKMEKIYSVVPAPGIADLKNFISTEFEPFLPDERLTDFFLSSENQEMFYIHSEIEKLKLFALSKNFTTITFHQVDEILNGLSEQVIFKIMDYLSEKKISQALKLFRETLIIEGEHKVSPLLISMFFKHFKALMKGKILVRENKTSEFFSYLSKNRIFYLKNNGIRLTENYTNRKLLVALKKLSEIELGMKGANKVRITETAIELEQFMVNYF